MLTLSPEDAFGKLRGRLPESEPVFPAWHHFCMNPVQAAGRVGPRLAAALNVSEKSITDSFRMLEGICDEVVRLLAAKPAGRTMFGVLRKMSHFRQIDVARTMVGLGNYSVKFAQAMLQHTPADQLAADTKVVVPRSGGTETVQRLQRELAAMQADTKLIEDSYGDLALQLAIIKSHIKSLLDNAHVVRWLARFNNDYLQQLQLVAELKRLPSE